MTDKLLGVALLLFAGIFLLIAFDPLKIGISLSEFRRPLTLSEMISEDVEWMEKKNLVPKEWTSIQYVAYNFNSDLQRKLLNNQKVNIKDQPNGNFRLELEFIDVPDNEHPSLIVQMSLIHLASRNKVWEIGRTYSLDAYLQKKSSPNGNDNPQAKKNPTR